MHLTAAVSIVVLYKHKLAIIVDIINQSLNQHYYIGGKIVLESGHDNRKTQSRQCLYLDLGTFSKSLVLLVKS